MSLTTPDVIAILLLDVLFVFFGFLCFFLSVGIVKNWNLESTSTGQYRLEKQSYLVATMIKFLFALKLPLIIYFIFTLDLVANVIPGAMCAAGVVNATPYGVYLLVLKIVNLYLFGFWLAIHVYDMKHPDYPYTRRKFALFFLVFVLFQTEIALEFLMFSAIDPHVIVSCCGTLFNAVSQSPIASFTALPDAVILGLFYGSFAVLMVCFFLRRAALFALSNLGFLLIAILSIIGFFSSYIYELPTHNCPFCFFQSDYCYVGYFLYLTLFAGTFFGIGSFVIQYATKESPAKWFVTSVLFNTIYLIAITLYPTVFYLRNGVWL
ncbi:MAG: hypothetical protein CSA81_08065 [Acidobacteria bacterium]|nr:MAG: hypothetical protein CSA81_08065 [Acidobacteriota bacterium]PIE90825.1 MAG: hypothetical protein CR997_04160 [Acidobacteriota bacterium]